MVKWKRTLHNIKLTAFLKIENLIIVKACLVFAKTMSQQHKFSVWKKLTKTRMVVCF